MVVPLANSWSGLRGRKDNGSPFGKRVIMIVPTSTGIYSNEDIASFSNRRQAFVLRIADLRRKVHKFPGGNAAYIQIVYLEKAGQRM